jgi:hypothetical protein
MFALFFMHYIEGYRFPVLKGFASSYILKCLYSNVCAFFLHDIEGYRFPVRTGFASTYLKRKLKSLRFFYLN